MTKRPAAIVELCAAVLGVVGAVWAWNSGVRTTRFAATSDTPAFSATAYSGTWILLSFVLVALASVLLIDAVRRGSGQVESEPSDT